MQTGAWCRFTNFDATCFMLMRDDLYFGTQDGIVMQAERTGYDDGNHAKTPYIATLVGGWEMFGAPSNHVALAAITCDVLDQFPATAAAIAISGDHQLRGERCRIHCRRCPTRMRAGSGWRDVWDERLYGPAGSGIPARGDAGRDARLRAVG